MDLKKTDNQNVDINFESHPPIEDDLDGIATLLKQTLLNFVDCNTLAKQLISLQDVTQIIVSEGVDDTERGDNPDDEDEPDDNIFGVVSYIDLEQSKELTKFLKVKFPEVNKLMTSDEKPRVALIINERYINLPPQLSLPTLKHLTEHLNKIKYTHLVFFSKVMLKSKKISTKKRKTDQGQEIMEPVVYLNPEEEIIFENCKTHEDMDVSSYCEAADDNYIPHRRIMIVEYNNWPDVLNKLDKELNV